MPYESPPESRGAPSARPTGCPRRVPATRPGRGRPAEDPLAPKLTPVMAFVWGLPALYLLLLVLLWGFQDRIAFPAPRAALPDPQKVLGYGERIELTMRDGTRLVGWYLPPGGGGGPLPPFSPPFWVFWHGASTW